MLEAIRNFLWSYPTYIVFILCGGYFTFKSRFFQITRFKYSIRRTVKSLSAKGDGISPLQSLSTVIGGTVGIGSITGVALAIREGGYGSIFWMWITGLLGCMLKSGEIAAGIKYRKKLNGIYTGGAMYALKANGFGFSASAFAVFGICCSFTTGNLTQCGSVVTVFADIGFNPVFICAILSVITLLSVFGGRKQIARVCGKTVPVSGVIYIILTLYIIITNITSLPVVFYKIISSAFGAKPAVCGTLGYGFASAVRSGVSKGIFSSEAGMGSSPLAHCSNENCDESDAAALGVTEVFADIFLFSSLTAICLAISGKTSVSDMFFMYFGNTGKYIFSLLIFVFGFASVISWCYYGDTCVMYLFPKSRIMPSLYRILYSVCAALAFIPDTETVWYIADIFNLLMSLPNLFIIFYKRKELALCMRA